VNRILVLRIIRHGVSSLQSTARTTQTVRATQVVVTCVVLRFSFYIISDVKCEQAPKLQVVERFTVTPPLKSSKGSFRCAHKSHACAAQRKLSRQQLLPISNANLSATWTQTMTQRKASFGLWSSVSRCRVATGIILDLQVYIYNMNLENIPPLCTRTQVNRSCLLSGSILGRFIRSRSGEPIV